MVPETVGTGFVISTGPRRVMCVTASHVLEHAVRLGANIGAELPGHPRIEVDQSHIDIVLQKGRVRGFVGNGSAALQYCATALWGSPHVDLAIVSFLLLDEAPAFQPLSMAVDTTPVESGAVVSTVGLQSPKFSFRERRDGIALFDYQWSYSPRRGLVTAVHQGGILQKCTNYECTIPTTFGMSGGPAIASRSGDPGPYGVLGCISSGSSDTEEVIDTSMDGKSTIIPMAFLNLFEFPSEDGNHCNMDALCERGIARDLNEQRSRIRLRFDENDILIIVEEADASS